jgi:hypothetical protein
VLIHILVGPSVGGLFGLIGYAINRGDRFRRLLVLIGVVMAIGAAACAAWWLAHGGQL